MPIRVQCDYCNYSFLVRDALANRHCKCPSCSAVILIPGASGEFFSGISNGNPAVSPQPSMALDVEGIDARGDKDKLSDRAVPAKAVGQPAYKASPDSHFERKERPRPMADGHLSQGEHGRSRSMPGNRSSAPKPVVGRREPPGSDTPAGSPKSPKPAVIPRRDRPGVGQSAVVRRVSMAPRALTEEERQQVARRVLAAFQGPIQPVPQPTSYILSLVGALIVLFILPLCYVLLIGVAGYAIYLYATYSPNWLGSHGFRGYAALLVYVGPIATGIIFIVFMIKPFFAPRAKVPNTMSLSPQKEPLLFAFVEKVCQTVRAPLPRRIDIDCDVNASASFRRGLLSFFGNDLVLTIGLPLVGGMTMNQFAGVLAHEFGHFGQRAAMRLTYLVRTIAGWFHRIATERDAWDEWLIETSKNVDLRIGVFLYLARALVFCSRLILFGLMLAGWAVIGILLRQMEFDADRHEIRLAGSTTFRETFHRLRRLSVAARLAENAMEKLLSEGRLPDDYPALVQHQEVHIPPDLWQEVEKRVQEESTGWWDTHPCDRDRLQAADKEDVVGVFHVDLPASLLFSDFASLCRAATVAWYKSSLEDRFSVEMLYPVEEFTRRLDRQAKADQAFFRFLQGPIVPGRLMPLVEIHKPQTVGDLIAAIKKGRQQTAERAQNYEDWSDQYQKALANELLATLGVRLCETSRETGRAAQKDAKERDELQLARDEARAERERLGQQMSQWEEAAMRRLTAGLRLLGDPKVRRLGGFTGGHVARVKELVKVYQLLEKHFCEEDRLFREKYLLQIMLSGEYDDRIASYVSDQVVNQIGELAKCASAYRSHFEGIAFPLEHAQQGITVAQYLCESPISDQLGDAYAEIAKMVERIQDLRANLLAELITIAEQVEKAIGFEPLPERSANEPGTD